MKFSKQWALPKNLLITFDGGTEYGSWFLNPDPKFFIVRVCPSPLISLMSRTFLVQYFLQGVSIACYAEEACISYDRDVCLSLCHTLVLSENDAS